MNKSNNNNGMSSAIQILNDLQAFCLVPDSWDSLGWTVFRTIYFDQSAFLLLLLLFMFACNLTNIWFCLAIRQDLKQRKESCKHFNLMIKDESVKTATSSTPAIPHQG